MTFICFNKYIVYILKKQLIVKKKPKIDPEDFLAFVKKFFGEKNIPIEITIKGDSITVDVKKDRTE